MNEKIKKEVYFADEKHIWIDGRQYIRLDRFLEVKNDAAVEGKILYDKCVELHEENQSLKKLLKINLSTAGGPEYE